jgi:asparagine synthase (glutamine-hydrolysing)
MKQMSLSADEFSSASIVHPLSYVLFRQMPMQGYGRYAIERSQVVMRAPFLSNQMVESLYRASSWPHALSNCSFEIIRRRCPELLSIPTDVGGLGSGPAALRWAHRIYRKSLAKAEYLTSHGASHSLALLSGCLPEGVLETRFLGVDKFQHFRYWIRSSISTYVQDVLRPGDDSRLAEWFDLQRVAVIVNEHVAGRRNYTDEIDKVLTVALTYKLLLSPTRTVAICSTPAPLKIRDLATAPAHDMAGL